MLQAEQKTIMSYSEKRAAERADFEAWNRRENRMLALVCVGSFVGGIVLMIAGIAAGPFIIALLRRFWAYYGVM